MDMDLGWSLRAVADRVGSLNPPTSCPHNRCHGVSFPFARVCSDAHELNYTTRLICFNFAAPNPRLRLRRLDDTRFTGHDMNFNTAVYLGILEEVQIDHHWVKSWGSLQNL